MAHGRRSKRGGVGAWRLEPLEPRALLSSAFTADEVYLAELINRARSDPAAESARLGIDLTEGLTAQEYALFGPSEPLALNLSLTLAARAHSLDMADRAFFDHINPDGENPTDRALGAGYGGVAGEAIGAGQPNVDRLFESWMASVENRVSILSLIPEFDGSFHYDHVGPGFATDLADADDHYTAMFGDPGAGTTAWLLGVVYGDADADGFYSPGEGAGGVRIDVAAAANPGTIVATFTTDDAGNYQLELGDGSWLVTFTDTVSGDLVTKSVSTDGENAKLDATTDELEGQGSGGGGGGGGGDDGGGGSGGGGDGGGGGSGGDGGGSGGDDDDHADDGEYPSASLIALDAEGDGTASGTIGTGADTDLFYFTAGFAGVLTVTLDGGSGELVGAITLRDDGGVPLAFEFASQAGATVTLLWNVPAGEQFFVVVGAAGQASTGGYTLSIDVSPADDGGGEGGGGGGGNGGGGNNDGGGGGGDDGGNGGGGESPDDDDPPVDATSDGNGSFTIVRTDANGRPIVYFQGSDGTWTRVDLLGEAGGPTPEGRFSTFVDPDTGAASVLSATSAGLALYWRDGSGGWHVRNLSVELGAGAIESAPVTFTTRAGLVYIGGLDAEGNLVVYRHTGDSDSDGRRAWAFEDLTTDHLEAQGLTMPSLRGGTIISYVTTWNGLTLAGLDDQGRVFAAWWAPGMERWNLANLSRITGAPRYEGTISAYLTPWSGINIAGTDENGDLAVVWWVPSFGGEWRLTRLNRLLGGPALTEGSIASWVTPWGALNVSGLTAEGDVVVYWWSPTSDGWRITTLSDAITDVDPPARGVIGHTSSRGEISIMGLSEAGDLVRYWWLPGGRWRGENLSVG